VRVGARARAAMLAPRHKILAGLAKEKEKGIDDGFSL
jgi:hypothetical protein